MKIKLSEGFWWVEVLALGIVMRLYPIFGANFPLNDGGMFYAMIKDLVNSGFRLPLYTSYNGGQIPFAYPPLGFYVGGIVWKILGVNLIQVVQFLPAVFMILTLPVFYLLAREILGKERSLWAFFVYAILPSAYLWGVAGGGITRAPGLLWALLTILMFIKYVKGKNKKFIWIAGLSLGMTFLSHLEMSIFALLAIGIWALRYRANIKEWWWFVFLGGVISSPWWLWILMNLGWGPFIAAWKSNTIVSGSRIVLLTLQFTQEQNIAWLAVIGAIGFLILLAKKQYALLIWFVSNFIFLKRGSDLVSSVIWAMISAEAINAACILTKGIKQKLVFVLAVVWLVVYLGGIVQNTGSGSLGMKENLSAADRKAMSWVKENTEIKSKFLVVSGNPAGEWPMDATAEWFPALSERESVQTIQGMEWVSGQQLERYKNWQKLYICMQSYNDCFDFMDKFITNLDIDYLYLTSQERCVVEKCNELNAYASFEIKMKKWEKVYARDGVSVWKRKPEV